MDTIKNYLENMFSQLPKTEEINKIKKELLYNMEDKYEELKAEGKSENEAIGIVISEFGNIDELLNELEISIPKNDENSLTKDAAYEFLDVRKKSFFLVSIGVSLIMLGTAILILLYQLIEDGIIFSNFSKKVLDFIPLFPLFILLVPAIGLFIYSGTTIEKYKFIEDGNFNLTFDAKSSLENKLNEYNKKHTLALILAVCLCVLSPIPIFIGSMISDEASIYGLTILLLIVAIAVSIFINTGSQKEGYKQLLKLEEYNDKVRKENKVYGAAASIVWPIATCIYLFQGFIYNAWSTSWIIFPITGILFGAFCAVYSIIKKDTEN